MRYRSRVRRAASPIGALLALALLANAPEVRTNGAGAQEAPRSVADIVRNVRPGKRVVFVGLDGADWNLLDQYVARGVMPNLGRLAAEGFSGRLRTMDPPLSPVLWTTMMTGVSPIAHRILDFAQFDPATGQKEPILSSERRAPAIWNMATAGGKRSAVFGLWATYPAEAIDGLIVSDRLFSFLFRGAIPPAGVVFPRQRESWARDAVTRASRAVDYSELRTYLPWLSDADFRSASESGHPYAQPTSALRRILIEERVYRELSLEWIEKERPDLAVVYVEGTDAIGHVFAPYAPPRQRSISQRDFDRYQAVPERFFRLIDEALGQFARAAAASGAVLMIASDHGFVWGDRRPSATANGTTANAAAWHAPEGIYLIWGPGVAPNTGHNAQGGIQQIAATLLSLLGLPPGRDLEGLPLDGVDRPSQPRADYTGRYKPAVPPSPSTGRAVVDAERLEELRSLGYLSSSSASGNSTRTPESYNNEGGFLRSLGKSTEAMAAFEHAISLDPSLLSAQRNLSELLYERRQNLDRSDRLLIGVLAGNLPGSGQYVADRATAYRQDGQPLRGVRLLDAAVRARPRDLELWRFRGRYLLDSKDCKGASTSFERLIALASQSAWAHAALGEARLCLGDRTGAHEAFERSLAIDPNQPKVRQLLQTTAER